MSTNKITIGAIGVAMLASTSFNAMAEDSLTNVGSGYPSNTPPAPYTKIEFKREVPRNMVGQFRAFDYTGDNVTQIEKDDAPQDASDDRLSISVYGGTQHVIDAAASAGHNFATKLHDVTLVALDDDDGNPNTAKILVCADGRCVQEISNIPNSYNQKAIGDAVTKALFTAYMSDIKPYLVDDPVENIATAAEPIAGIN